MASKRAIGSDILNLEVTAGKSLLVSQYIFSYPRSTHMRTTLTLAAAIPSGRVLTAATIIDSLLTWLKSSIKGIKLDPHQPSGYSANTRNIVKFGTRQRLGGRMAWSSSNRLSQRKKHGKRMAKRITGTMKCGVPKPYDAPRVRPRINNRIAVNILPCRQYHSSRKNLTHVDTPIGSNRFSRPSTLIWTCRSGIAINDAAAAGRLVIEVNSDREVHEGLPAAEPVLSLTLGTSIS